MKKTPQHQISRRHMLKATAGSAIISTSLAAPAISQNLQQLTMVTSWPKSSPGPGWSADRIAADITRLSNGQISVKIYAAGELVPSLQVFDAVAQRTADMAHSASFFWVGKMKGSVFYTTVPLGFTPIEHQAWLHHGGGQALWQELYEPFGIIPFAAGNSGMQMGGWFKREILNADDLQGLKMRVPGLGGELMRRFGVQPVILPPAEIFSALNSNLIDAAEFLGPWSDQAFGFQKAASYYYGPSFNEPNGNGELIFNKEKWDSLPLNAQQIITHVTQLENNRALTETSWYNALSFQLLQSEKNLTIAPWADDIIVKAKQYAPEVLEEFVAGDEMAIKILDSYRHAMASIGKWSSFGMANILSWRL